MRELHAQGLSCSEIARRLGRSAATVSEHCKAMGLSFDRTRTIIATQAAVADNKALRATTSRRFLEKANQLLDQMDEPHIVFNIGGKDNVYTEHLMDRAPTADLRNLMASATAAFDKHLAADKHDADQTEAMNSVDQWLDSLTAGDGH